MLPSGNCCQGSTVLWILMEVMYRTESSVAKLFRCSALFREEEGRIYIRPSMSVLVSWSYSSFQPSAFSKEMDGTPALILFWSFPDSDHSALWWQAQAQLFVSPKVLTQAPVLAKNITRVVHGVLREKWRPILPLDWEQEAGKGYSVCCGFKCIK